MLKHISKLISLTIVSIIVLFVTDKVSAYQLIEDFNDNNLDDWVVVPDPDRDFCVDNWHVSGGRLEIEIEQTGCTTNLMPNDDLWNNLGNNYVIEVDAWFRRGSDHNIAFRFTPSSPSNDWYDFHFVDQNRVELERVPGDISTKRIYYPFPNGLTPYHLVILVQQGNIQLEVDGVTVLNHSYDATVEPFPTGRFSFRAGTGAAPRSYTYFDNLIVTPVDNRLDVRHFSQRDPEWKDEEYDHSSGHNPVGKREIENWGCAMTSAAMVLDYHGYTLGPDSSVTNPENLNKYLINNKGYTKRGGVVWSAITKYTKDATPSAALNPDLGLLEFKYSTVSAEFIQTDLDAESPPIIKIVMNDKNTPEWSDDDDHFAVVRGFEEERIDINDPLDLSDTEATMGGKYSDKILRQLARFSMTNSDLSYLWIYEYNSNVNVIVEYEGTQTGWNGGVVEEINLSSAIDESVIGLPDEFTEGFGDYDNGGQLVLIQKPESGKYLIKLSSEENQSADMEIFAYNKDAEVVYFEKQRATGRNREVVYELDFDKELGTWSLTEPQNDWPDDKPHKPYKWNKWWKWGQSWWKPWFGKHNWWHHGKSWNHNKSGFWNLVN
ncbi:C39 family peptidase [Pseudomonadota bacterium]